MVALAITLAFTSREGRLYLVKRGLHRWPYPLAGEEEDEVGRVLVHRAGQVELGHVGRNLPRTRYTGARLAHPLRMVASAMSAVCGWAADLVSFAEVGHLPVPRQHQQVRDVREQARRRGVHRRQHDARSQALHAPPTGG